MWYVIFYFLFTVVLIHSSNSLPDSFDSPTHNLLHTHAGYNQSTHTGNTYSSPSASSSSLSCLPAQYTIDTYSGFEIVNDVFLRNYSTGSRVSVFCPSLSAIQYSLLLHGVYYEGLSLQDCQTALIRHFVSGSCYSNKLKVESHSSSGYDYSTCINISKSFTNSNELSSAVLDILINSDSMSIDKLMRIVDALQIYIPCSKENIRARNLKLLLLNYKENSQQMNNIPCMAENIFNSFETLHKPDLCNLACKHGISITSRDTKASIRHLIMLHVSKGDCLNNVSEGCQNIIKDYKESMHTGANNLSETDIRIYLLSSVLPNTSANSLRRLLHLNNIQFSATDGVAKLRRSLKKFITSLKKGKFVENQRQLRYEQFNARHDQHNENLADLSKNWPQVVPLTLKDKILNMFHESTSSKALATFTCASCGAETLKTDCQVMHINDFDHNLLAPPIDLKFQLPISCVDNLNLGNMMLDFHGINKNKNNESQLLLCKECHRNLAKSKIPPLSLANYNYLGDIPDVLKDLTVVEEAMIARCRAKCWIIQLQEEYTTIDLPNVQHGMKGHIIIYPQQPSKIAEILPPSINEIITPICVLFIGSSPPTAEWLREKAKPLCVRREKVRNALVWLKQNNSLYHDIILNEDVINSLDDESILPFHIQHVLPSYAADVLTSRYDASAQINKNTNAENSNIEKTADPSVVQNEQILFQNVVITDVEAHAPSHELRAAALRHVKQNGGGYIKIPHDPKPINEFFNPDLLPMVYPTLFPYGIGGPENHKRASALSFKRHIKHFFNLSDRRFQEHYSFLFTVFNIIQRRAILLHTSLKVKRSNFDNVAASFASVSPEAIHLVTERIARGDFTTVNNADERKVLQLMKQVKSVTSNVPGSSAARLVMRNEIRALMFDKGLPSFYITINPADIYNPLVKFLSGEDIDIDNLLPEHVPNYKDQSILIAKNPAIAAKFFNIYMKAFIHSILGYDPLHNNLEGGILGVVKAYYGCVEAQGRGTLHCHMLIWIEGSLNPNEIKKRVFEDGDTIFRDRLLAFLDDTISNSIPFDPDSNTITPSSIYHPCTVRGINPLSNNDECRSKQQKDLHNLVSKCQIHEHTHTCFKYWKGPPHAKECRFDMHEDNVQPISSFNSETGDLCLRCLDGLVNNFNSTIIQAVRCNMDIKFIGSGAAAKAMTYYVTDYITKSQLKTHVAFAALESAINKLDHFDPNDDDLTFRAKRLLQRCAYAMISQQELSAQQVVSYLMDFEDHFTSHKFRNLYWTSFEKFINDDDPSPECYQSSKADLSMQDDEPTADNDDSNEQYSNENPITCNNNSDSTQNNSNTAQLDFDDNLEDIDNSELDNDEIVISVNQDGVVKAKTPQVMDYQLRGSDLSNLCVWDYVAQIDKISKRNNNSSDDSDNEEEDNVNNSDDYNITDSYSILGKQFNGKRPQIPFLNEHIDSDTHMSRVRTPNTRFIPVPIGPAIPRRDHINAKSKYCRLMLILFKPWRKSSDLRELNQSWEDAFNEFATTCPHDLLKIIDNMQIMHECKDSRDDHFIQRQNQRRLATYSGQHLNKKISDDFNLQEDEHILLDHLESIQMCTSLKNLRFQEATADAVCHAENSGMFTIKDNNGHTNISTDNETNAINIDSINYSETCAEDIWRSAYDDRRDAWKHRNELSINATSHTNTVTNAGTDSIISSGDDFRNALRNSNDNIITAEIETNFPQQQQELIDIDHMITEFTLNTEQARAFRIIAQHSTKSNPDPLRMFIGGPGGTGKSRVINTLTEYFTRSQQQRRFRLASFTGIAARNISGTTLHSALCLNQREKKGGNSSKTKRDLHAMWEGVDYLFIDEVSMVGCSLLLKISEALIEAKGNTLPFGGINIIFAGDFAQLPPVGQTRLYSNIDTSRAKSANKKGQNDIGGKLLWLSIKTVVIFTEIMRQAGEENEIFVDLLSRLREGRCTSIDYDILSSRVLQHQTIDWNLWENTPIIVSDNATKDALNEHAAIAFAANTKQPLHWYYCTDTHGNTTITDHDLQQHLYKLSSGQTNQRLGRIPLAIGMPIIITQNFDVQGGIVNGTSGILKSIRYRLDNKGNRHAISCVIESPNITGERLPYLNAHEAVALEDTIDMTFIHPHSQKKCTIKRTQLPIVPAFAMTAHKSQGQTLNRVIVDLESCRGTEAPYVMISRVTSLSGLLILRPFTKNKIQCHQSEDLRKEMKRLYKLKLDTIIQVGTQSEINAALDKLSVLNYPTSKSKPGNFTATEHHQKPTSTVTSSRRITKQPLPVSHGSNIHHQQTNAAIPSNLNLRGHKPVNLNSSNSQNLMSRSSIITHDNPPLQRDDPIPHSLSLTDQHIILPHETALPQIDSTAVMTPSSPKRLLSDTTDTDMTKRIKRRRLL
jgi:hypothetical protein